MAVFADLVRQDADTAGVLNIFDANSSAMVVRVPTKRRWATALPYNQTTVVLMGGCNYNGSIRDNAVFVGLTGSPTKVFNLTSPKLIPTCVLIDSNRIFITGGFKDWFK